MYPVGVIGAGVVGSSVAVTLFQKGYPIRGVCSKQGASAATLAAQVNGVQKDDPEDVLEEARIIFLTTPDREISNVAAKLAVSGKVHNEHIFIHMSGALPLSILAPLQEKGAGICSLHPLQAFAGVKKAVENLPGTWFALQHDGKTGEIGHQLVRDMGGQAFSIRDEQKALYHLGASMASNFLVALVHLASGIYGKIGLSREEAVQALMPLLKGTLDNIETMGSVQALTGPIARGDEETVRRHIKAFDQGDILFHQIYQSLGAYTVQVALEKGSINRDQAGPLNKILQEGYNNGSKE